MGTEDNTPKTTVVVHAWMERILWALLTGISMTGVTALKEMSSSVNELNQRIAVILEKMSTHEKELSDHNQRLHSLEDRQFKRSR